MDNNSFKADFLVIGAGFAGATFARCAADAGYSSHVIERRDHIGGNCFSYKDEETGIEIHKYGPHIFHTNSKEVWDFINRFTEFYSYIHRVKANYNGSIYSLPINLHTINQFYNKGFSPSEAQLFIDGIRIIKEPVKNFEDYILTSLGEDLYNAFFKHYTIKQWGKDPKEIPISTAKRLPIRFNYDDAYFNDTYCGIPVEGYTKIFERMLTHEKIQVKLGSSYEEYKSNWRNKYKNLVFTGSLDEYFNYQYGFLPYRTVKFKEIRGTEIIGASVMNYTDSKFPFTRIHEHKWFTPVIKFQKSVAFEEYSEFTDSRMNPFYPIREIGSEEMISSYEQLKKNETDVVFIGRLAEFRYYDMHQVIASSISKFKELIKK